MKFSKIIPFGLILSVFFALSCKKEENNDPGPSAFAVTTTSPLNNAINVSTNTSIQVKFNSTVNSSTLSATTFTVKQGTDLVAGTVSNNDSLVSFMPSTDLQAQKLYTVTLTTGVKNAAGLALANNYVFSFTTGVAVVDVTKPLVTLTGPAHNATDVPRNKTIEIVFSESMKAQTITNTSITLKQGSTLVAGTVTYSGTTAFFNPSEILLSGAVYTVNVSTDVQDLAGNPLDTDATLKFTTVDNTTSLAAVNLGASGNYVILAKTAINNIPTSNITGDLALSPAAASYITGLALTAATGYATSSQVTGKIYAADMAAPTPINLTTAVNDMVTAYNDAAGRSLPDFVAFNTGNIGGKTLLPGLYKWTNTVTAPSSVTISGSATDVWIFQISGDLTVSSGVNITLVGGAQAKNIFWQVAGQVTVGTTAHMEGVFLSKTGITFAKGASLKGRALAQTAVILDANTITQP